MCIYIHMETQTATKTLWAVDPAHSEIGFKVRHMMISTVSGQFNSFDIKVESDRDDFVDAQVEATIDIHSIDTNATDRDNHLKSADFFDADNHPTIHFVSRSFDGSRLVGDLTIRGITKTVEMHAEMHGVAVDPYGQTKAGFEVSGEFDRHDFGLSWNAVTEAGHVVVSKNVKLIMNVQLIRQ